MIKKVNKIDGNASFRIDMSDFKQPSKKSHTNVNKVNNIIIDIINSYKEQAINDKLEWNISDEYAIHLINDNCIYCDGGTSDVEKNIIDMFDNSEGFIVGNCVTSCSTCITMRGGADPLSFILKVLDIGITHNGNNGTKSYIMKDILKEVKYETFVNECSKGKVDNTLQLNEYIHLISNTCFYCCVGYCKGVYMIDENLGYTNGNSISCCSECRNMRGKMGSDEFIMRCKKVMNVFRRYRNVIKWKNVKDDDNNCCDDDVKSYLLSSKIIYVRKDCKHKGPIKAKKVSVNKVNVEDKQNDVTKNKYVVRRFES